MRYLIRFARRTALVIPFTALLYSPSPISAATILGTAANFAVLGGSTVTNTGPTTLNGDLGVYPGSSITGLGSITFVGASTNQGNDAVSQQAQVDEANAYNILKLQPFTMDLTGHDLGTSGTSPIGTLDAGVYKFDSTAQLNGTLILDAQNNPNAIFIFQIGTALTTASGSSVQVINGGANVGVYWLMGVTGGAGTGSATLGTTTVFEGNILALDSITLTTNAEILCGRALAQDAAVTMDTNTVSNNCVAFNGGSGRNDFGSEGFSGGSGSIQVLPEPGSLALFIMGFIGLAGAWFRRCSVRTNSQLVERIER